MTIYSPCGLCKLISNDKQNRILTVLDVVQSCGSKVRADRASPKLGYVSCEELPIFCIWDSHTCVSAVSR